MSKFIGIGDVLLLFLGSYEQLEELHTYLNSCHPTMKFDKPEYNKDDNSTNFLDMKIRIVENKIVTDLFRKPSDKPTALLPSSSHPGHITPNIVYSMGYRLMRICSTADSFKYRLNELKENFLIPRGYKSKLIDFQFERLRNLPGDTFEDKRKFSLKKKVRENKQEDRVIVPIDYNPHMAQPSMVMRKHYTAMIKKNPNLQEIFPAPPMPALRQPKNLKRILCSSRLKPVKRINRLRRKTHKGADGWKRCGKPCHICPYTLPPCSEVMGEASGHIHEITHPVDCETRNCIYYWKCIKENCVDYPKCEYIGMTTRKFKERMAEHRDYPKQGVQTEPSGKQFTQHGQTVAD